MHTKTITTALIDTPIGLMIAGATNKGICILSYSEQDKLKANQGYEFIEGSSKHIDQLKIQLEEYFKKERIKFDVPLDLIGTDFQIEVWNELLRIPHGKTRTYKEQSIAVGNLKAIRAVASANGSNKISIVIPCHRVIGSDGSLTGFAGGLWRKKFLLDLESNQTSLF